MENKQYVLFLDASKEFDRVCYSELFNILLEQQKFKWLLCSNVVKQDAVIPPICLPLIWINYLNN